MGVKMKVEGGAMAIYDEIDGDLPFTDPFNNMKRVYFHSILDYLEAFYIYQADMTFPLTLYPAALTRTYSLTDHGLGEVPFFMMMVNGKVLDPYGLIQYVGPKSAPTAIRRIRLYANDSTAYINEYANTFTTVNLTAITVNVSVVGFRKAPSSGNNRHLYMNTKTGELAIGDFSLGNAKRLRVVTANQLAYLSKPGRTVDSVNGWARVYTADGDYVDPDGNYVDRVPPFEPAGSWKVSV